MNNLSQNSLAILPLVIAPNPLLKQTSKLVEKVDDNLREFMQKMVKTMYFEGGIGLAAVKVGVLQRIFVMDIDYETIEHDDHHDVNHKCDEIHTTNCKPHFFVNPEIFEESPEKSGFNEGCLSFPTLRAEISRPKKIQLRFLDFYGNQQTKSFDGIAATCIQHEIDHLNGITFVDYLNPIKRELMLKKLKKLKKNGRI